MNSVWEDGAKKEAGEIILGLKKKIKKQKPHNLQVISYSVSDQTAQKKNKGSRPVGTGPSSQGWVRRAAPPPKASGKAEAPSAAGVRGRRRGRAQERQRELSALR